MSFAVYIKGGLYIHDTGSVCLMIKYRSHSLIELYQLHTPVPLSLEKKYDKSLHLNFV